MPRQRGRGTGRPGRGAKRQRGKSTNSSTGAVPDNTNIPSADIICTSEAPQQMMEPSADIICTSVAPQPRISNRTSRGRGRGSRNRSSRGSDNFADVTVIEDDQDSPISTPAPQRRRTQRRKTRRQRPQVISLDVTYSSDDLEDLSDDHSPTPEKRLRPLSLVMTPSPAKGSDSDESELDFTREEIKSPDVTEEKPPQNDYFSDSDMEEDLFSIDYNAKRENAFKATAMKMKSIKRKENKHKMIDDSNISMGDLVDIGNSSSLNETSALEKSRYLDMSIDSSDVKPKKRTKRRTIKSAKKLIKKLSKEVSDEALLMSLNETNDIIIESDEDPNPTLMLLIRWESTLLRWSVRQYQKFSSVYQGVADRFNVNVAQVLLCFNDKVIKPDACPKDLKLSSGDVIEGGAQSKPVLVEKNANVSTERTHSPDSIPLKVQNADRRGSVTIYIKKQDKMIVLMHRYAEEKNVKLENIRFCFDGEKLDPKDTPETLDLDGNECIDVYAK